MTVVAVSMVRDEADIIRSTMGHLLDEVDRVIVADNRSTDGTREILAELEHETGGRLTVVDDPDPAYRQSAKMTALARRARHEHRADWIVPVDADEWWYSPFGRIADVLEAVADQWLVVPAPLFDHVATADDDPTIVDPVRRLRWRRREPAPLPKVAARWRRDLIIEQGNHGAQYRGGPTVFDPLLVVRHYPYRSVDQLVRKIRNGSAAYRAAGDEVPEHHGAHWRQWGRLLDERGEDAIAELFHTWYWRKFPQRPLEIAGEKQGSLILDPPPGVTP